MTDRCSQCQSPIRYLASSHSSKQPITVDYKPVMNGDVRILSNDTAQVIGPNGSIALEELAEGRPLFLQHVCRYAKKQGLIPAVPVVTLLLLLAGCRKAEYEGLPPDCREYGVLASIEYRYGQRDVFATFTTTDGRSVTGKWWVDNAVPPVGSRICWSATTGTIMTLKPWPEEK